LGSCERLPTLERSTGGSSLRSRTRAHRRCGWKGRCERHTQLPTPYASLSGTCAAPPISACCHPAACAARSRSKLRMRRMLCW
jgi:hypothetical protein